MKTDRELLELAAKAFIGACLLSGMTEDSAVAEMINGKEVWNPLTDNADALRLAIRLGLVVDTERCRAIKASRLASGHKDWVYVEDYYADDDLSSVRLAIVIVAAAIGEKL